ncbi:hypothetical protein B0T25DRAFT_547411, partial [Lasiosphaeria hispida]
MDPVSQANDSLQALRLSDEVEQPTPQTPVLYELIPVDDARILRVLKLAPGLGRDPLTGTFKLVAGVGESNETRPPSENLRRMGVSQAIADPVQAAREASGKSSGEDEAPGTGSLVQYEALSYVWGNLTKTKSMTLNGTIFRIPENLEVALICLRQPDTERVLWVDTLYI